jgi:hypothetical protein
MFPGRIIWRSGDSAWPTRTADLLAPDNFLRENLKAKVYVNKPRALGQLKEYISGEIRHIHKLVLRAVIVNFQSRLQDCISCQGDRLRNVT